MASDDKSKSDPHTAGFLAEEAEHCQHLDKMAAAMREAGDHVQGVGTLPELLPDGSYAQEETEDDAQVEALEKEQPDDTEM